MKTRSKPIRLVLADDHPLVRAGIRAELEALDSVEVVGQASNGREALDLVRALHPDIVFIDVSMPGLNGIEALARIKKEFRDARVIVLSMHDDQEYVFRAIRAGAAGYLLKRSATAELGEALQHAMRGEVYLCKEIAARLVKNFPLNSLAHSQSPVEKLTERQREILQLIAEGRNTKEIGAILSVSPKTVEYHRMKLMQILDLHDIPALVRFAFRTGLATHEN